jgi:molybdate/tungstate transport system permease protein
MIVPLLIAGLHLVLHAWLGHLGWIRPFELFNLLLLAANLVLAVLAAQRRIGRLMGPAVMILIASHALIGQQLAPDSLTSGAILMVNILTVYAGFKIFENLPLSYGLLFAGSYGALFYIFILRMSHAEPLFLLALMGLAATGRSRRMLAFFWALVIAFTAGQPYAWETAFILFVLLTAAFSAKGRIPSNAARLFLVAGLAFLGALLLPVVILLIGQTPQSLADVLREPEARKAIWLTAQTATLSTLILALFGIPLAYALSRLEFKGKALVLSLIDVPVVIPQSVAGIALLMAFGRAQPIGGGLFDWLGVRFDGAVAGIVLAQVFVALPFLVKPAMAAFDAVPPPLELAARHLGANSLGAFRHLALPLASRGLFLAAVLTWARAAGEFGAVYFMTASPAVTPIAVFTRFERMGLAETAPLVSTLLLLSLGLFFLLQLVSRRIPTLHAPEGGAP